MKTLQNFKKEKIELKSINGGKVNGNSSSFIWFKPGGASTEGNYVTAIATDGGGFFELKPLLDALSSL